MTEAPEKPVLAICGKGGVGKTAVCALLSRVLLDAGVRPLLLVDADPVMGLTSAIGERVAKTLGTVREEVLASVREGEDAKQALADRLDYLVLEALEERDGYSLLAMGRKREEGCFCPVNSLLRDALDLLLGPFAAVLIDAEAGIEQVNRQVTRRTSQILLVTDGSRRAAATLALLAELRGANRGATAEALPEGLDLAAMIPEDETLRRFDQEGRSLWDLPPDGPAMLAARRLAQALRLLGRS
jgi:CO dehydrogenase maturation factor